MDSIVFVIFNIWILCVWIQLSNAKTTVTLGDRGSICVIGGEVRGRCEEIQSCLQDGGVIQHSGQVTLCKGQGQGKSIHVCCRKPRQIADELCDAWSIYWRGEDQKCTKDKTLIVGGTKADIGEFPNMAVLGISDRRGNIVWNCGGSLITPHFVLTAAHCVLEKNRKYWVELGVNDRSVMSDEQLERIQGPIPSSLYKVDELRGESSDTAPRRQRIRVIEVISHPDYLHARKYHDIALLKLETPAKLTKRVIPACLSTDRKRDHSNKNFTIAGWGSRGSDISALIQDLQKATIPVNDLLECQASVASRDRIVASVGLLEDQICAGKEGTDSCSGDSGGPMMGQEVRNGTVCEQTVFGVVAFGFGCGVFGIYTRVSFYIDWIIGYVAPNASI